MKNLKNKVKSLLYVYMYRSIYYNLVMGVFSPVFSRLVGRPTAGSQLTRANKVQVGLEVRDVPSWRFF